MPSLYVPLRPDQWRSVHEMAEAENRDIREFIAHLIDTEIVRWEQHKRALRRFEITEVA